LRRNVHGFSCRKYSLPNAEDICQRLDKINDESEINRFFASTFHVEDKDRGLFGIDLADKAQCKRQYIYDTGIIAPETLLLPYTGVNIEGIVKDIIEVSKLSTSAPRRKCLLATLRGVGGGKTRMIEEARIRLGLLYPNWLPIAVTFNHLSTISSYEYMWKDPNLIIACAVCCRMMAAIYNITTTTMQIRMKVVLKGIENSEDALMMSQLAENLIVGTVQHIAGRVKRVKPAVDSLVLFIDESAKLIEHPSYPAEVSDGYALLRQTILGGRVGEAFKTSLVMTSLSVSVFGTTESGQGIKPVVLASKLSGDHIVDRMWMPFFSGSSSPIDARERSMLKWLAASVGAAPRLVELMGLALRAEVADTWSASGQGLGLRQSMGAVLSAFDDLRDMSYADVRFPVGKYLHALIHQTPIAMDDITLEYVRSSSFTNSIAAFPGKKKENRYIIPESALCLLAGTSEANPDDIISMEIQEEIKVIWGSLVNHIKSPLGSSLGQPLDDLFAKVLRMRIVSSHLKEHFPGFATLRDLLAIDTINNIKYTIGGRPYNATKISTTGKTVVQGGAQKNFDQWEADTFEHGDESLAKKRVLLDLLSRPIIVPEVVGIEPLSSSRNLSAWKNSIRNTSTSMVLKIPRPNNDHSDLMLFVKLAPSRTASLSSDRDNIVVVFEEKSKREDSNDSNLFWWGHFTQSEGGMEKYDQYGKFCAAVASIAESDLDDDQGFLRALMEGRFLYVYVTDETPASTA